MRVVAPEVEASTPRPGVKWSAPLVTASIGTRTGAVQVFPVVEVDTMMSLPVQPLRKRQSAQDTYTLPEASISADGSTLSRSPCWMTAVLLMSSASRPATVWWLVLATRTLEVQLLPPLVEVKARIWLELAEENGTITVPLGWTSG